MADKYRIIHCLNQFFGGLGGEEKASMPPSVIDGARGPGLLLQQQFPDVMVVATVIFGDNYIAEKTKTATQEIIDLLAPYFISSKAERPVLLLAGPAFNAGRYGIGCGAICQAVYSHYGVPSVTAMFPENPAVDEYKKEVYIAKAGADALGMEDALEKMMGLGLKLLGQEMVLPEQDHYIPQGRRKNFFSSQTGARRAVNLLLQKLHGETYETEYPMPTFDRVTPAPPISDISRAKLALVTSGGIVPHGNPDRIEAANAQKYGSYSIKDIKVLTAASHQTVHGGYDPTFANENPNRVLPLDAVRDLESAGAFGALHDTYYATVGNATSVANAQKYGRSIAEKLLANAVQAVILTST